MKKHGKRSAEKMIRSVETSIPEEQSFYHEWISFALKWANLERLKQHQKKADMPDDLSKQCGTLRETVDKAFVKWLFLRYAGLYNQPPNPPVMLHHIPGFWRIKQTSPPKKRSHLFWVDGLSMAQWLSFEMCSKIK